MAGSQSISITPLLQKLLDPSHGAATSDEIAAALALIFENRLSTAQCASFLTLLQSTGRGEDPEVVAKCAAQMRSAGAQIDRHLLRSTIKKRNRKQGNYLGGLCDHVGTGGDGHSTFNVSTTASIIASSLLLVCKHGAKAASSKSGSADMLQAIAPKPPIIEAINADNVTKAFEKGINFAFCFAPVFHPGLRHVAPLRKDLGFRTIFNILGPLSNQANELIEARVYGVARRELGPIYARAAQMAGAKRALVVNGAESLDEISCAGKTFCWRLKETPNPDFRGPKDQDEDYTTSDEDAPPRMLVEIDEFELHPKDFGLPPHPLKDVLPGQMPQENARTLIKLLKNELPPDDPVLHFVLINTAALFVVSGLCDAEESHMGEGDSGVVIKEIGPGGGRWKEGVRRARWAVESGAALKSLEQYIEVTNSL